MFLAFPEHLEELEITNVELDMRSVFNNKTFSKSLRALTIRNSRKQKTLSGKLIPTFDIKEIEAVGGLLENLSEFTLAGCIVTDEMLKCLFSGFSKLKSLRLIDCHGFSNHVFLWACILLQQLEELRIEGGPHDYLRSITFEGMQVFRTNKRPISRLALNYCAKVGQQCVQIAADCFE